MGGAARQPADGIQALADWSLAPTEQNHIFRVALSHMSQGLCMFDSELRLILCNDAYADMYGLAPEDTRPGTPLRQILERRVSVGSAPVGAENYVESRLAAVGAGPGAWFVVDQLSNGRYVAITHRSLPDGGSVATHEDITERRRAEEQIAYMAHHDSLTGLANRGYFQEQLAGAVTALEGGGGFGLLYLDLDNFKVINDTLGHSIGDGLLEQVAERLVGCLGQGGSAARLGGDEFAVIQLDLAQPCHAEKLAKRIVEVMAQRFVVGKHDLRVGVSVGIALAPEHGTEPDQLLRKADVALYRAKWAGRGTLRIFEPGMDPAVPHGAPALMRDLRSRVAGG